MQMLVAVFHSIKGLLGFRLQKYVGRTLTARYALYLQQYDLLELKLKQIAAQHYQISAHMAAKKTFRQLIIIFKNNQQGQDFEILLKKCHQSRKHMIEAFHVDSLISTSLGYSPSHVDETCLNTAIFEIECIILFCECFFQQIEWPDFNFNNR